MLDTTHPVETPEGVSIHLRLAGPPTRGLAWLTDMAIRLGVYYVLASILALFGEMGVGIVLILIFIGEWFYPVIFEVKNKGQTPGKRMLNLQVVKEDGAPIGWNESVLRNLLRFVDLLPGVGLLGMVAMFCSKNNKRLGDMAAGTLVVYREEEKIRIYTDLQAKPSPPPVALDIIEQAALVAFAERAPKLSKEREEELASMVEPLTGGKGDVVAKLRSQAAYLVGRRS